VKKFLRGDGGIRIYDKVHITWIRGRPPVLKVFNGLGRRGERVAEQSFRLEAYDTHEKLHALMVKCGFQLTQQNHDRSP